MTARRVLIVEDNRNEAAVIARALEKRGDLVKSVTTPAEALDTLTGQQPTLAIVDLDYAVARVDSLVIEHQGAIGVIRCLADRRIPFVLNSAVTEDNRGLPLLAITTLFQPAGMRSKEQPLGDLLRLLDHVSDGLTRPLPDRYQLPDRSHLTDLIRTQEDLAIWQAFTSPALTTRRDYATAANVTQRRITRLTDRWLPHVTAILATLTSTTPKAAPYERSTASCAAFARENRLFFTDTALPGLIRSSWWR